MDNPFLMQESAKGELFRLGTISSYSSSTGALVRFDGEDSASDKRYKANTSGSYSSGTRVLCARVGGTWVVICPL